MMLVHHSDLVNLDEAKEGWVGDFDDEAASLLESGGTHALSALGVLGDPRGSNAELGEQYLELWTGLYAQVVRGQFQQVLVSP
jgi:creatinine amidohydrolase/Fe(II)-dependent formamide hydrolase-like protein